MEMTVSAVSDEKLRKRQREVEMKTTGEEVLEPRRQDNSARSPQGPQAGAL